MSDKQIDMARKKELFEVLNGFFDHIYLITLRESTNRQKYFKKELDGLDYEIMWAINGSDLDLRQIVADGIYDPSLTKSISASGKELVPGEVGCALSHLKVYEDMLERGFQRILVLEDDLIVESKLLNHLKKSIQELPENWDVIYLGFHRREKVTLPIAFRIKIAYPILSWLGFSKYSANKLRCTYPRPYSKNLQRAGAHYGTYAYGLTATAAKKIIAGQSPICRAADNAISRMIVEGAIRAFKVKQKVLYQSRIFTSTILGR